LPAPVPLPALTPAQAEVALKALRAADQDGLDPKDYLPGDPADAAGLAKGLVAYAHDLKVGRLQPGEFPAMWSVRPAPRSPAAGRTSRPGAARRLQPCGSTRNSSAHVL
jgi:hypothetical protein